jgi:hypothetical protein
VFCGGAPLRRLVDRIEKMQEVENNHTS